jgi:hypothetical protein
MADDSFNGATLTFSTVAIGPLRSISVDDTAPEANTTGAGDAVATAKGGVPKLAITCEVVGGVTVSPGDIGDLDVAWVDIGSSTLGSIGDAEVGSVSTTGSMDGEITSTVTFFKTAPTS